MLNKRITKSLRNKIIAGVLVFVTLLGGGIGYKYQRDQINNLKYQLELKQDKDNQDKGYYISIADVESIENEFNKLKIFSSVLLSLIKISLFFVKSVCLIMLLIHSSTALYALYIGTIISTIFYLLKNYSCSANPFSNFLKIIYPTINTTTLNKVTIKSPDISGH